MKGRKALTFCSETKRNLVIFYLSAQLLRNRSTEFRDICTYEGKNTICTCRCAYRRKFWFNFFLGVIPLLNLEIWPIEYTNVSAQILLTAQQNFMKLFSSYGQTVYMCIFTEIFPKRTIRTQFRATCVKSV